MTDLLLFLSRYDDLTKDLIAATLAWLADEIGLKFEIYYDAYSSGKHFSPYFPEDQFGSTVLGGSHRERFYFINRVFKVKYAIFGHPEFFSSHFLKNIRADIIVETQDLLEFYKKIFSYFKVRFPEQAVLAETRPFQSNSVFSKNRRSKLVRNLAKNLFDKFLSSKRPVPSNKIYLTPYCYPEIYQRRALGLGYAALTDLKVNDFEKIYALFIPNEATKDLKNRGLDIEVVDQFQPNDTYWAVTNRIMNRWREYSEGVDFCDPVLASYWLPWLCRHKRLAVYETFMESVRNQMRDLILTTNKDRIVYGRQSADRDITELSKDNIIWNIMDPGRPVFPVVEEVDYRMYQPENSYYNFEPEEDDLKALAEKNKILCSLIFYSPDIRHAEVLPRILELAALTKIKIGLAITAQWYQMVPEVLEMINIPLESGGAFPNVEPLLCSAGLGVGVEADGFLDATTLREHLSEARRIISEKVHSEFVPKGHYPFLDTIKDYPYAKSVLRCTNNVAPPFKALEDSDLAYSISYASPGRPRVLYRSEDFIAINQSSRHWYQYSPFLVISDPDEIKNIEINLAARRKPGWIIVALDSPLWLFSFYSWKKSSELFDAVSYIQRGGVTGKLVNATPHTISRYARLLDEEGLL